MTNLLVAAIIAVESGGNDWARGRASELGALQIRAGVVRDVNHRFGLQYKHNDMTNRAAAIHVFDCYMKMYATENRLRRPVTDADRARIWNGGPDGWRKAATIGYAERVRRVTR